MANLPTTPVSKNLQFTYSISQGFGSGVPEFLFAPKGSDGNTFDATGYNVSSLVVNKGLPSDPTAVSTSAPTISAAGPTGLTIGLSTSATTTLADEMSSTSRPYVLSATDGTDTIIVAVGNIVENVIP